MIVTPVCNMSLLEIIKDNSPISYGKLSNIYKVPETPGVFQGRNLLFNDELKNLETLGYIKEDENMIITYIKGL